MTFSAQDFLPANILARLTEIRVSEPERSLQVAKERKRRAALTNNGRLNILAADHPARWSDATYSIRATMTL